MGFTLSVWMRGRTVSLLCKSRNVFHWAVTSAYTLNRLFHISKSEKQPMLYVIHVSERQKKCLFFPTWSFIGMFRSLHWHKGESCFCLRYPLSPSLNLRMFYPPVWFLFEIPLPPPHVRPHSVPQQFLLNKLAKNHVPAWFLLPLCCCPGSTTACDICSFLLPPQSTRDLGKWLTHIRCRPQDRQSSIGSYGSHLFNTFLQPIYIRIRIIGMSSQDTNTWCEIVEWWILIKYADTTQIFSF